MSKNWDHKITISVKSEYETTLSNPKKNEYVFNYQITLHNEGVISAKLLARHWVITNGEGKQQIIKGEGVVGEQPALPSGSTFSYSSTVMIDTPFGTMEGFYIFLDSNNQKFETKIPLFQLALPYVVQ